MLDAGFASAEVQVIDEDVKWASADQFLSQLSSWWTCAARLDGVDDKRREGFMEDATETVRRAHPGAFETTGRNHVLFATA